MTEPEGPGKFLGDEEGYRAYVVEHPAKPNSHWCIEHWMPCPVGGKNGMLATLLLTGESFALLPDDIKNTSAINSWWQNQTTPACCQLGDEKMAYLWAFVDYIGSERACMSPPWPGDPKLAGRHACFLLADHRGVHDWQVKVRSIFDYDVGIERPWLST